MKFTINKLNFAAIAAQAQAAGKKDRKLEITAGGRVSVLPRFGAIMPSVYRALDEEGYMEIWLKGFPFCVVNEKSRDHILPEKRARRGKKTAACRQCKYFKDCVGFPAGYFKKYGDGEIAPIKDLPVEVMVEVEPKCNFNCQFCFNKISFAKQGRNAGPFSSDYVKKIIDGVAEAGIKIIRFTGGEPMLGKEIFELLRYAKKKKLETRLNTNGSLLDERTVKKLAGLVDNILIPIESCDDKTEEKLCSFPDALKKKIKAIKLLKKAGIPMVRAGSVASRDIILNFDKMAELILDLPVDEWEFYRPAAVGKQAGPGKADLNLLVDKIFQLRNRTDKIVSIANAVPFCAVKDLNKINAVSSGALFDEGHSRLVIDPRGFAKPHYFIDENLGDPLKILKAWRHPFMKKMRSLGFLPKSCNRCNFRYKCRGGSRYAAKLDGGQWSGRDPLVNKKI